MGVGVANIWFGQSLHLGMTYARKSVINQQGISDAKSKSDKKSTLNLNVKRFSCHTIV
jgi:hypothetical protein